MKHIHTVEYYSALKREFRVREMARWIKCLPHCLTGMKMNSDPQQPHKKLGRRECVCNRGTREMGSLDKLARQTSQSVALGSVRSHASENEAESD